MGPNHGIAVQGSITPMQDSVLPLRPLKKSSVLSPHVRPIFKKNSETQGTIINLVKTSHFSRFAMREREKKKNVLHQP